MEEDARTPVRLTVGTLDPAPRSTKSTGSAEPVAHWNTDEHRKASIGVSRSL